MVLQYGVDYGVMNDADLNIRFRKKDRDLHEQKVPSRLPYGDPENRQKTLCHACGWKGEYEDVTFFEPSLKVIYAVQSRGSWSIGSKYILTERTIHDLDPILATKNMDFVRENTTIPVPKIVMQWKDVEKVYTLMERLPGKTIQQLWDEGSLTWGEIDGYAQEVAGYLEQLRQFTSTSARRLDGRPYKESLIAWGTTILHGEKEEYFANWNGTEAQRKEAEDLFP